MRCSPEGVEAVPLIRPRRNNPLSKREPQGRHRPLGRVNRVASCTAEGDPESSRHAPGWQEPSARTVANWACLNSEPQIQRDVAILSQRNGVRMTSLEAECASRMRVIRTKRNSLPTVMTHKCRQACRGRPRCTRLARPRLAMSAIGRLCCKSRQAGSVK